MSLSLYIREVLALHEAFRRLGFAADDIYVWSDNGKQVGVLLKAQGKEFLAMVAEVGTDPEVLRAEWERASAYWNSDACSELERKAVWEDSNVRQSSTLFLAALLAKGFVLPRSAKHLN